MVKQPMPEQVVIVIDKTAGDLSAPEPGPGGPPTSGKTPGALRSRSRAGSSAPTANARRRSTTAPESPRHTHVSRIGRYALLEKIGQGGMGAVYRAYDPVTERIVAVKVLLWGTMANRLERQRFLQEARAAAHLNHPGIVRVLDTGVHEGCPYFTMEYVAGPSLHAVLEEQGPYQVQAALQLLATIATAVHYAHGQGIIHRDLKPANILLEDGHAPRVIDFGIAAHEGEVLDEVGSGRLGGTPAYMSPEQATIGLARTGPRSDVFSLGALFFHMLTGYPPPTGFLERGPQFTAELLEVSRQKRHGTRLYAEALMLSSKAMALDPADRYGSALELSQEARRLLSLPAR